MSSGKTHGNKDKKNKPEGVSSIFIKQIVASIICVAFVMGMKFCGNTRMANYTDSLGYAIRHDTDWSIIYTSVVSWVENKISPFFDFNKEDTQEHYTDADEMTFH